MKAVILGVALLSMGACCDQADIERRKIALEEQKYRDEQTAKAAATQREADERSRQRGAWEACRGDADDEYNRQFKLWGHPVEGKPGMRQGPAEQMNHLDTIRQYAKDQCDREYPKRIGGGNQ